MLLWLDEPMGDVLVVFLTGAFLKVGVGGILFFSAAGLGGVGLVTVFLMVVVF